MNIYLDEEHRNNREKALRVASEIVFTSLDDIASRIYIDPIRSTVVANLDTQLMETRGVLLENLKELKLSGCSVELEGESLTFTPKDSKRLKRAHDKAPSILVKGIQGIRRALVSYENEEWSITTEGSNLAKVLKVPGIDPSRMTTNDIHEVAKVLGIEGARNVLIKEADEVLIEQGLDVDMRHIMLVADIMCQTGEVRQIGRHGVSGEKSSVIAKAAFEVTVSTLVNAALTGTKDMFKGATESVIVGQNIPIGTGLIELYMGHKVE
jgi:DNA-directed RNA polymerase subunit A"